MDNRYYFNKKESQFAFFCDGEAQHLTKVRRAKLGDKIVGFNGDGLDYNLEIVEITKSEVKTKILSTSDNRASGDVEICVYLAMLKNDALTTAIDHLAELNVKTVKLFASDFTVANIDEKKLEKLNNICIQASKQCERADFVNISSMKYKQVLDRLKNYDLVLFAYENTTNPFIDDLKNYMI